MLPYGCVINYPMIGRTADLTVVLQTVTDFLHAETDSPLKKLALSKRINGKLSGRTKSGRRRWMIDRNSFSLQRTVKKS